MNCPICGKACDARGDQAHDKNSAARYRPFCSRRCADLDLAKWMNGSYAVPSEAPQDAEAALDELERRAEGPFGPH